MTRKQTLKISGLLYSLFGGAAYDFSTIKNRELFLSYPKNFNDPFDGAILINRVEFEKEFLKRKFGEDFVLIAYSKLPKHGLSDVFGLIKQYKTIKKDFPYAISLCPKECEIFLDVDVDNLKKECFSLYESYIKNIKEIRNEYGVACFTTNSPESNMVMWSHYADHYRGFCCKFEFDYYNVGTPRDENGTGNILQHLHKVIYTKKIPCLDVKMLLDCSPDDLRKSKYIHKFIKKTLNVKHPQWRYENEYRIIIHKDSDLFKKTFDKNNRGFKIAFPYLTKLYIDSEKCIDETSIKDIAIAHKIKYYLLIPSTEGVCFEEDISEINYHNILLDSDRILNSFTSLEPSSKEGLPF